MNSLEIKRVSKSFGGFAAVNSLSFEVHAGEVCGFIGPNGAGKTTTMRICATLELPDYGDVRVCGASVLSDPRGVRRKLGFMPDSYGAYAQTTVEEYIDFYARAYGLRGKERRRSIASVSDFTGLSSLAGKDIQKLSKGMKQRLCLAKTLLHDPAVLILDEPAAGLDPHARIELRELVLALAQMGKCVLLSSHILTELAELCSSVAVIERGRLKATGNLLEIQRGLTPHAELYLRALAPPERLQRYLAEQPGIAKLRGEREGFCFEFSGDDRARAELLSALVSAGMQPVELVGRAVNLEDVFLHLTQGHVQ